ncbi:unnamed protein product [Cylindrotheca closterium]|uniref:Lipoxygenase domain-containing protein n=1 Tax=Cylindrotheca closterium TaxID=2856 RepID=A0AAD2G575_9STRA|nr:unnamed protein product [Cylindrotheca closterium]
MSTNLFRCSPPSYKYEQEADEIFGICWWQRSAFIHLFIHFVPRYYTKVVVTTPTPTPTPTSMNKEVLPVPPAPPNLVDASENEYDNSQSNNGSSGHNHSGNHSTVGDLLEVPKKSPTMKRNNTRLSLAGSFMQSFNTEVAYAHLKSKDARSFKSYVGLGATVVLMVSYAMARFLSRDYHSGFHGSTASLLLFGGYNLMRKKYRVLVSDADRTIFAVNVFVSTAVALLLIFLFESSCIHCAFFVVEDSSEGVGLMDAAEFLLVQADGLDRKTLACQTCTSACFSFFFYFMDSPRVTFVEDNDAQHKVLEGMDEITDIASLAHSIDELNDQQKTADTKSFQRKILYEVAQRGHLDIGEAFSSYLCSPSSRVVGDTSVEFLDLIESPRFSGESINLTVAEMSSIMKGDILKDIGVAACFILRFALFVPDDPAIDHIKIEPGAPPIMNEDKMKVLDATADIPGLVIPQIDPEVDKQGVAIMLTKSLMDAYVKFPFNNEPIYFNTRDEYYFFYRWNMEHSVQDEWYFPNWLLKGRTRNKMIEVMTKRNTLAADILAFEQPTTDETLSDRVFYGTGQKYLTPIKLPGIHDDYELMFPHNSNTFVSRNHEKFFRCKKKPKREDLERMIKSFYLDNKEVVSSLYDWKDRIVEIDFAIVESIPSRELFYSPGVILYLDVDSKLPIGIWESSREQMFLPKEGRNWEHAKYFYRVCERAVLASDHVIRSHFGMSQAVATASLQTLPENHGLRALVKPFVHGVQQVNSAAYHMLVRDHSVLTHASGFTSEGVIATFLTLQQGFNYSESIPEYFSKTKLDSVLEEELPLHSQGLRLYKVHRKWVSRYMKLLYPTDEELLADEAIHRFWSHLDTYGRHLDPCVCSMPSSIDFEDDTQWPGFESFRTCKGLLDRNDFKTDNKFSLRREGWCKRSAYVRLTSLREWIESDCEQSDTCTHVSYNFYQMRDNMAMGPLKNRDQLVDFLATFIWDVTAGHTFNSDNVSYLADPEYSGVRMREYDENGNLPLRTDIGTYIFGTSIASLTTVRCPPLMADWSHIYRDYVFDQKDLPVDRKMELSKKFKEIHMDYKHELLNLASVFIDEAAYHGGNKVSHVLNPMTQASSVSV